MFENLSKRLSEIFQNLIRAGRVKEEDLEEATQKLKLALLEADVNYQVVKNFIERVKEKALGQKIMESLTPAQQIIKIVNEELTFILGEGKRELQFSQEKPTVIMLAGLQGSGKTTTCGKLGKYLKKLNKKVLLSALDPYRPAAMEQLKEVGKRVEIPVFAIETSKNVLHIARESLNFARKNDFDVLILDTAGRLHIDEELMQELVEVKKITNPGEILLVADGLTGQDAVNLAKAFNEKINLTGIILTKLDGDARGGAALSMVSVANCPIKFIGVGEKFDDLELFYPDRVASRILGMGDVLTLIEKVQENIDLKEAEKLEKKLRKDQFTLNDFANQLKQIRKLGPLEKIFQMVPGFENISRQIKEVKIDPKKLDRLEAMVLSMTPEERENPEIIDGRRRQRIASGSGTTVQELNQFLKQFFSAKKMMQKITEMMGNKKGQPPFFPF